MITPDGRTLIVGETFANRLTAFDDHFATDAGFRFLRPDAVTHRSWGPELFAPDVA